MQKYIVFFLFVFSVAFSVQGQIFSEVSIIVDGKNYVGADVIDSTHYYSEDSLGKHPIFIFYTPGRNGIEKAGFLSAEIKDSTGKYFFDWYLFDTATLAFDSLIHQEPVPVTNSTLADIDYQGGFKVHIHNNTIGIDTSFYCWVYRPEFKLSKIDIEESTCTELKLKPDYKFESNFEYYDWVDSLYIPINHSIEGMGYHYEISPPLFDGKEELETGSIKPPPYEATRFSLTMTDQYGFERYSTLEIQEGETDKNDELIIKAVKADFEVTREFFPSDESVKGGGAELALSVQNNSLNYNQSVENGAKRFMWEYALYDSIKQDFVNYNTQYYDKPSDSVRFQIPGEYRILLTAYGVKYNAGGQIMQCEDTMAIDSIVVMKTKLPPLANAFTPEGASNNRFYFAEAETNTPKTIKYFSIKIYDRWGTRVHFYEGTMQDWKGWNGNIGSGSRKAATGVYFYFIKAESWDPDHELFDQHYGEVDDEDIQQQQQTETSLTKGFVHLFRE
jgi:hypothetical protein